MRFLLHPSTRHVVSKACKSKPAVVASRSGAPASVTARADGDTNAVKQKTCGGDNHHRQVRWGQQCNPDCGCVVRFQAVVNPTTNRYEAVDYVAQQVLTSNFNGRRASIQTSRGRPMLRECRCGTLHHLASEATHHLQGKSTSQALNMLEFHSTRSSASFRKAALATQGLPSSDTGCYDVMEEALTAMVKGHMPPFRQKRMAAGEGSEQPRVTLLKGRGYQKWTRGDHDAEHELDFRKFWNDYEVQKFPGPMSTLSMLDLSMSMISGHDEVVEEDKTQPQDWESYVDQLYEDEQESA